jgi:hypothetical protein
VCQDALYGASQALPIGIDKGDVMQSGVPVGRRQTAEALQGIEPDMMVVSAGRKEGTTPADPLPQFEPHHLGVKLDRAIKIGNSQVHMADPSAQVGIASHVAVHAVDPDELDPPHRKML